MNLRPLGKLFEQAAMPQEPGGSARLLYRAYRRAFAFATRCGGYAAAFQPNHLCSPTSVPLVATMHDLSVLEHPEWHPASRVARWERYLSTALRHTARWITVSQFTRERMQDLLGLEGSKITLIPEAARTLPTQDRLAGFPERCLLSIGTLEPRKNLQVLLDAFAMLPAALRRRTPLVLAGAPGWGNDAFWRSLIDHPMGQEVLVTGFLSEGQLGAALSRAAVLLLPSLYEGFGLPVLEGMAAGVPVICSDIAPFREVAGEAAKLVPAQDGEAWAGAIRESIEDDQWRERLQAAGRQRAESFSWELAARRHAELFQEVLSGRG